MIIKKAAMIPMKNIFTPHPELFCWLLEPVCKIFDFQKLPNKILLFLVRHGSKAVSVCNRFRPARAVFAITFVNLVAIWHAA